MKKFANKQEPVARVPPVIEPVVVENTSVGVAVQHRDVPIIVIHRERAYMSVSKAIMITTY